MGGKLVCGGEYTGVLGGGVHTEEGSPESSKKAEARVTEGRGLEVWVLRCSQGIEVRSGGAAAGYLPEQW